MFFVIFCLLVILFLILARIISIVLLTLATACDVFISNETLKVTIQIICIIGIIGVVISSIILAYQLTPDVLEYLK